MIVDRLIPYREAGFALHWLRPRSKAPVAEGWSTATVATADTLRATYLPGYNVGVRLGEPSNVAGAYLHAIDLDIRDTELADEAWETLHDLFDGVDIDSLPSVVSGSGGESRHIYFVTDKPFYSRKLAVSEGKHRSSDGKWHYDWEIELFGTGKQVAFPPSIHPDTGKEYHWERPFDLDTLALGVAPTIPAARLSDIAETISETYAFEEIEPLTFKKGQLERELAEIPAERIDDYHDWVTLGQALHHQFGGAKPGYLLWLEHSKRSWQSSRPGEKFDAGDMPSKWRGFGRNRRRPVTMASVRQWVIDSRHEALVDAIDDAFDDLPEPDDTADDDIGDTDTITRDPLDDPVETGDTADDDDIDPLDKPVELTWVNLLDLNEEGGIKPNLHNVTLIVRNDPRIAKVPELNLFTSEMVQRGPISTKPDHRRNAAKPSMQLRPDIWQVEDTVNGTLWNDTRDNDIRRVFEAPRTQGGYGIKITDRDLTAAIDIVAQEQAFHPIREYLQSLEWDGVERVDRLFVDHLGAPNNCYTRDIARLTLIAAVTRVFEPGHKFDHAVIIEGLQGRGKSTFINLLGKSWYAELDGDFHDTKQMVELMQGAWIMEIPELSGFNRTDVRAIKAFMSRRKDRARLAYARRAGEFPRQCIFIGSTNDREYLKDDTGGRRFWPVFCSIYEIDFKHLEGQVDQLWAEALLLYRAMRAAQPHGTLPLYLKDRKSRAIAESMQETRRVESTDDALLGRIEAWLDVPVQSGGFDDNEGKLRERTCLMQIWVDCLGGKIDQYPPQSQQALGRAMARMPGWEQTGDRENFGTKFGRQRVYRRVVDETTPEDLIG